MKIFGGNANPDLAKSICDSLGKKPAGIQVGVFSDGEISLSILESVRGADVFIVQSTCPPVNQNLMELLIIIDACKRASAGRITAVIPYFGYARQDRKAKPRDPISAKLVSNLIATAGADRVLTMDLHTSQIQGFFDIPVDNLLGMPIFARYYKDKFRAEVADLVAVSADIGSVARTRSFAQRLSIPLAIVDKRRQKANASEVMNIIGNVAGKKVILFDDLIDTAGSITGAAAALMKEGAAEIYACATHAVMSGPAKQRICDSPIKELVVLDTVPLTRDCPDKVCSLTSAAVFSEAIERIYEEMSISALFD